ncbi:hypothetical protein HJC23_011740 [Cyclotella cryptica]|uniref:Uncharacterized protein n=1 Tax=Cyclotella cryptica TaxID=29204 RepID=A0ABD3PIB3_9STRA|eukprot:CCRYP_014783-RB/>CCRYP_014783-RB protein AED:0.17 eAED:0.17 QI:560/1/1/1/0.33/0/4/3574/121
MKYLTTLCLIFTSTARAFQATMPHHSHHRTTALHFYPENFDRAQECATHYGICTVDELEQLANELDEFQHNEEGGGMQGRDHYVDTTQVAEMLRAQSELKHMMEKYVVVHHQPETFDMYDV